MRCDDREDGKVGLMRVNYNSLTLFAYSLRHRLVCHTTHMKLCKHTRTEAWVGCIVNDGGV